MTAALLEPWLDYKHLAEVFDCGVRWLEERKAEGMPHAIIAGKVKFRASVCQAWLDDHGFIEWRGEWPAERKAA